MTCNSARSLKYFGAREKEHYALKTKCSTITPVCRGVEDKVLLGIKDGGDTELDSPRHHRARPKALVKGNGGSALAKTQMTNLQSDIFLLNDTHPAGNEQVEWDVERTEEKDIADDNADKPDNAKSCMGSIGSWINDLFTTSSKRSVSCPRSAAKPSEPELLVEEDPEYYKSLNALKERFKKKLKNETTIILRDKPMEFNFDKVSGNEKKLKKKTKSLTARERTENLSKPPLNEGVSSLGRPTAEVYGQSLNSFVTESPEILRSDSPSLMKSKTKAAPKNRSVSGTLEEYILPTPTELSKRLLLNVNDSEKSIQMYKKPHISLQEAQHYNPRKNKSYQTSSRCYTTNAKPCESFGRPNSSMKPKSKHRNMHLLQNDSGERPPRRIPAGKGSFSPKKNIIKVELGETVSGFSTEASTSVKKSHKSLENASAILAKSKAKSTSDDLVKYLMKKIKVNYRSLPARRKPSSLTPVEFSAKNRFMQSATNSLVISVMAKKESDLKNGGDHKLAKMDNSMKVDIKKVGKINNVPDDSEKLPASNHFFEKHAYKNPKRLFGDDHLKTETKHCTEKQVKRQEIKNMLLKIDVQSNHHEDHKNKQKNKKKKVVKAAETTPRRENEDNTCKSFNLVGDDAIEDHNEDVPEKMYEGEPDSGIACLSTELAVIPPSLPLVPEKLKEIECHVAEDEPPEKPPLLAEDPDFNILDCLHYEEKLPHAKPLSPKTKLYKDKLYKTKSLQFIKPESPKSLLAPLAMNNPETHHQPKDFELTIPSNSVKSLSPFLGRRYPPPENQQQKFKGNSYNHFPPKSNFFANSAKDADGGDRSRPLDRKKERSLRGIYSDRVSHERGFVFEKTKKTAPSRKKEKIFP